MERPEDRVNQTVWSFKEVRINVFPNDLFVESHLKNAPKCAFGYQGVSVAQTASPGYVRAEEIKHGGVAILPDNLVRLGIHLYHARKRNPIIFREWTIIKDKYISVI